MLRPSLLLLFMLLVFGNAWAGPKRHGYYPDGSTSLGVRLGWVGAPNGVSFRRAFAPGQAFEAVLGYSGKYGRHADGPQINKGNTFLSLSYAPHLIMCVDGLGVGFYGDLGIRANFHHYRVSEYITDQPLLTPDVFGGIGMQVELAEAVEVFADLHVKYFSAPGHYYIPGMESGFGVRVRL